MLIEQNSVRNLGYINIQRREENGHKEAIIIQYE